MAGDSASTGGGLGARKGAEPLAPGTNVDRYAIEALIGRGGMGEVYRAVDSRLRRKVAIKVLRPETDSEKEAAASAGSSTRDDAVGRLFREARAAAALSHPNTVAIHDLGENEGLFYIVMELVGGQPLLAYVGDERISIARRLKWLTEISRALACAHKAGVIHRDVKPSNVMITEDDVAKVLDFGLAKPILKSGEPESMGFKTQAGRVLGTVRYMAPEQMIGTEADGRSDQYALGMTAYELLAGRYPAVKPFDLPPLLDSIMTGFPADGARAIARMIKRLPDDRFQSMEEVVTAFEDIAASRPVRALAVPGSSTPVDLPPRQEGSTVQTVPEQGGPIGTLRSVEDEEPGTATQPTVSATELGKQQVKITVGTSNVAVDAATAAGLAATIPGSDSLVARQAAHARAHEATRTLLSTRGGPTTPTAKTERAPGAADASNGPPVPMKNVTSTLASADAGETLAKVRALSATKKKEAPAVIEVIPPPAEAKPSADDTVSVKPKRSNLTLVILTILFLAIAAFAGNYFGARSRPGPN